MTAFRHILSIPEHAPAVNRLGNRSALERVINQHRVKEDKRNAIRSGSSNPDDPACIVRLVAQVVPLNPSVP